MPAVAAENWSGGPVAFGQESIVAPDFPVIPKTSTTNNEYILTQCGSYDPALHCALGVEDAVAFVPITAFARSSTVEALSGTVAGLSFDVARLQTAMGDPLTKRLFRGVALASALDFQSPAPGASNRLGGAVTTTHGQVAGSVAFTHRQGKFDVSAGAAFTSTDVLGKAAAGFSW
jgi:hypothetical protein